MFDVYEKTGWIVRLGLLVNFDGQDKNAGSIHTLFIIDSFNLITLGTIANQQGVPVVISKDAEKIVNITFSIIQQKRTNAQCRLMKSSRTVLPKESIHV